MWTKLKGMLVVVTVAWCISATAYAAPASDNSLKHIIDAKVLTVGVALNAPWVIKRPDGKYAGYDIDLVSAMASDLGVDIKIVEIPFGDLLPRLAKGDVDIVAAGLAITPERAEEAVFSSPLDLAGIHMVAADVKGKPVSLTTIASPGFKIAVLANSTDEAATRDAYPKATLLSMPNAADALAAVINGQAQAMVATDPVPQMAATLYDAHLSLVGAPLLRTAEAFAMRPDDDRLQKYVNNWIDARMADGFIPGTQSYWFRSLNWVRDLEGNVRPAKHPAAASSTGDKP